MCCIFTCCGWVIDLVQRFWTFTMSCCISSAVCCALVTASMSGVALGYNYSLAEYIELKETNVSVYLKRGVFDDEVADELEWRRSGGGKPPPARSAPEYTPPPQEAQAPFDARRQMDTTQMATDDDMPIRYGRRMDDSIFQSDDTRKYEGSLLKLTPYDIASTPKNTIPGLTIDASDFPGADPNAAKAIIGAMNSRRMMGDESYPTAGVIAVPVDGHMPMRPIIPRTKLDKDITTVKSLRFPEPELPRNGLRVRPIWRFAEPTPTIVHKAIGATLPPDPENVQDILSKLLRRTKVKTIGQMRVKTTTPPEETATTSTVRVIAGFKVAENVDEADFNQTGFKLSESEKSEQDNKDYNEEDIKGLPIRKRRHRRNINYSDPDSTSPTFSTVNTTDKLEVETPERETIGVDTKRNETKESNLLQKMISVVQNANSIFALAQRIKLELTKGNIAYNSTTCGLSTNCSSFSSSKELLEPNLLNTDNVSKVALSNNIQSTVNNDLLLKIIKSTIIPLI